MPAYCGNYLLAAFFTAGPFPDPPTNEKSPPFAQPCPGMRPVSTGSRRLPLMGNAGNQRERFGLKKFTSRCEQILHSFYEAADKASSSSSSFAAATAATGACRTQAGRIAHLLVDDAVIVIVAAVGDV